MPKNMHILYAGAGEIATQCAELLRNTATQQYALRRTASTNADSPFHCMQADLIMPRTLARLPASITHVLYTATPSQRSEQAYDEVYNTGLNNLLAALDLNNLKRFVFVSSTAVYGHSLELQDEHSPTLAPQFNGQALLEAEKRVQAALGDKATIIRFTGIYGPTRMALARKLMKSSVSVAATPGNWANRIHADDAASACAHLLRLPNPQSVYIATDDTPIEIATLYDHIAMLIGAPAPTHNKTAPATGKRFSNHALKKTGWTLKWPDTLEGYRAIIAAQTSPFT